MSEKIHIGTRPKKWRFECPEGHTNWFPIDGVFRCRQCARDAQHGKDVSPETSYLVDKKTGRHVRREEIVLDVDGASTRASG